MGSSLSLNSQSKFVAVEGRYHKKRIGDVNYLVETEHRTIRAHTNQIMIRYSDLEESNDLSFNTLLNLFQDEDRSKINK